MTPIFHLIIRDVKDTPDIDDFVRADTLSEAIDLFQERSPYVKDLDREFVKDNITEEGK